MPRYFVDEGAMHEWAAEEQELAQDPQFLEGAPEGWQPTDPADIDRLDRAPGSRVTYYEPASATFDAAALEGEEARVYRILRERGVSEVVVSYDGGHDEGFAHFEEAVTSDARLLKDDLARELHGGPLGDVPIEPHIWYRDGRVLTREQQAPDALEGYAEALAVRVLGVGFGVGELDLIGRLRANLITGQITDEDRPDDPPPYDDEPLEDE